MSRARDNVSMYWPIALALLLFLPVVWRYISLGDWEGHLKTIAVATFGFISTAAAEETTSWLGRYGWTYESFWTYPPTWIRTVGIIMLIGANVFGFAN